MKKHLVFGLALIFAFANISCQKSDAPSAPNEPGQSARLSEFEVEVMLDGSQNLTEFELANRVYAKLLALGRANDRQVTRRLSEQLLIEKENNLYKISRGKQ